MTADPVGMTHDQSTPPVALEVLVDNFPRSLRGLPRWVAWDWKRIAEPGKPERWTKVPKNARTLRNASSTDPATWSTLEAAVSAQRRHGLPGVGVVMIAGDRIMFIDLDHCRDAETGVIDEWAADICRRFPDTYQEESPSATGLRIMLEGTIPGDQHVHRVGPNGQKVEFFSERKYTTLTGHRLDGADDVTDCQDALDALYSELFATKATGAPEAGGEHDGASINVDDEALLDLARASATGHRFVALFDHGDAGAYGGDESAADLALVNDLRFWTAGDRERMDRLFRRSRLMRDKWDAKRGDRTYGQRTLDKALAGGGDTYSPAGADQTATWYAAAALATRPLAIGRRPIVRQPIGRRTIGRTRIATVVAGQAVPR